VLDAAKSYDNYEFYRIVQAAHQFCGVEMSAFYLDVIKDRLYADAADSHRRRSGQTVLYEITSTLTRLLAPILSFTTEEVWQQLQVPKKPRSVALTAFPSYRADRVDAKLAQDWEQILGFRDDVNKVLETARQSKQIGKPLEAKLTIVVNSALFRLLEPRLLDLPTILLVSQVILSEGDGPAFIQAHPAPGAKCSRCWLVKTDVDVSSQLCSRCGSVVSAG